LVPFCAHLLQCHDAHACAASGGLALKEWFAEVILLTDIRVVVAEVVVFTVVEVLQRGQLYDQGTTEPLEHDALQPVVGLHRGCDGDRRCT